MLCCSVFFFELFYLNVPRCHLVHTRSHTPWNVPLTLSAAQRLIRLVLVQLQSINKSVDVHELAHIDVTGLEVDFLCENGDDL